MRQIKGTSKQFWLHDTSPLPHKNWVILIVDRYIEARIQ